ncbi:MAG: O-antigen ligase family protein [Candidatus Improbicoccus pseudotrichonymphae]|uniref:O-antigen ligase family protein n=1 Tax=Candidatus Improbicoccus pseudotrichonymphae TaxID=3033792 RepID=A0AA48HYX0_9FIRM|nr:MAG: O-antigen ligase family protein [Candidatus Improbicoccus pseudotrichonymphae]
MLNSNNLKKVLINTSFFRITYVILSFLETLIFIDYIAFCAKCVVLIWGVFLLFYFIFREPEKLNIKYKKTALLFIFSGLITIFLNISPDFSVNLTFVYHSVMCFFIFFGIKNNTKEKYVKKEINFILLFFVVFSCLTSISGILFLLLKPNLGIKFLIAQDRFTGFYTNSNLTAFVSAVSVVSVYLFNEINININQRLKFLLNFSTFVNILSLFLSDSNASFILIAVYFIIKFFITKIINFSSVKKINFLKEFLYSAFMITIFFLVLFLLRNFVQNIMSYFINNICSTKNIKIDNITTENSVLNTVNNNSIKENIKIGRENYKKNQDISSGRIILFKQGIRLFLTHPIFGIGRGNLVNFGNYYINGGLIFSDLHNSYLTILVSYGIVGFSLFMFFCVGTILKLFYEIFKKKYSKNLFIIIDFFSILSAYLAHATFEKGILSEMTFMVIYFWIMLGFSYSFIED